MRVAATPCVHGLQSVFVGGSARTPFKCKYERCMFIENSARCQNLLLSIEFVPLFTL